MNVATNDKQKYLEITFVINLKLKTIFSKEQKSGCDCGAVLIKKMFYWLLSPSAYQSHFSHIFFSVINRFVWKTEIHCGYLTS